MRANRSGDVSQRFAGMQKVIFLAFGGIVVACGFAVVALKLYSFGVVVSTPDLPNVVVDAPSPMTKPDLHAAPPLPTAAELSAVEGQARELLAAEGTLPVWADGCDPVALAWASMAPAAISRRVGAYELYRAKLLPGTSIHLRGDVVDHVPANANSPWQRVVVAVDSGAFVEVLASATSDLPERVAIDGIFLGRDALSSATGSVAYALVAARSIVRDQSAPAPIEAPAIREWPAVAQDPRWQSIDDHSMVDDTAPYYAMLAIVASDVPAKEPPLLNAFASKAYDDAPTYRGRPVRVTGTVVRAWEDQLVAADHPAGITRVVRVLMHHLDVGPLTERGADGKTRMARLDVLRLYELALISDGPLPKPGEQVLADGRFLRLVARPIVPRAGHVEGGDRAYALFAVCRSAQVLIDPGLGRLPIWRAGVMVVSIVLGAGLIWYGWVQRREYRDLAARLAVNRQQRNDLLARLADQRSRDADRT